MQVAPPEAETDSQEFGALGLQRHEFRRSVPCQVDRDRTDETLQERPSHDGFRAQYVDPLCRLLLERSPQHVHPGGGTPPNFA